MQIPATDPADAAVELRWDNQALGVAVLRGRESHRWRFAVTPGVHLVEVTNLAGRPLRPAGLSLEPPPPSG